jgi:exodeoxyribonuclease VII small subunit
MTAEQNFESSIHELEQIVKQLEQGDLALEETLKKFEHGMKLAQFCQQSLNDAQKKIEQLKPTQENDDN